MRFGPPVGFARRPDGHKIAYQLLGDAELDLVLLLGYATHLGLLWEKPSVAGFLHKLAAFSRLTCSTASVAACPTVAPAARASRTTWTTSPWSWTPSAPSGRPSSAPTWTGGWRCCSPPPTRSGPARWSPTPRTRPACATRTSPGAPARRNVIGSW